MKNLSKEKKSQLVLVTVLSCVVATGLYMGLIKYQQEKLGLLRIEREKAVKKLQQFSETSRNSGRIKAELETISTELDRREEGMTSGDLYAVLINTIRKFKIPYEVEITQFNSKGEASMGLIPRFPYKQFTVTIIGTSYYHDLGKFIADFENQFPSSRILNVELVPDGGQSASETEKLSFRMDIVSLVKPGATPEKHP